MSNPKLGEELRNLMWDEKCGFSIMSYCDTGFLSGNECALLKVILDEANRDPESCCRLKKEALAYLSMQSEKTMFRSLNALMDLGLIISDKIHNGALKYINRIAWIRLKEIYKHEVNGKRHKNIFVPRVLRDEMKARGITSILDLTKNMLDDVYAKAEMMRKKLTEVRQNAGSDGKNAIDEDLDSVKFTANQGGWIVSNLPPTGVIEYYNKKTNVRKGIQGEGVKSIFQYNQDYTVQEEQRYLRKRKRNKR